MQKRTFLKSIPILGVLATSISEELSRSLPAHNDAAPETLARDESYWKAIRAGYRLKPDYINLENGYYCFIPQSTLENYIHHIRMVNYEGSYYMRLKQFDNKKAISKTLSEIAGCDEDELIITRNTTESLDTVISGFPWKSGDEAIMAEQDYGAMLNQFELLAKTRGIVNKRISIPNHPVSDDEIVELYERAITPKTKMLMICHMINITGQILPVRKICDMAHKHGVEVIVDGAHAFSHFQFSIRDLDCDYYGTSLHKWLSVPLGAGFLYVKKTKVSQLTPVFAPWDKEENDVFKLNHTGTHPVHTDLAILNALEFQDTIGLSYKEARLRYLQNYWKERLQDVPNVVINTPFPKERSCGIGNVGLSNMSPGDMAKLLLDKFRIWTVAIDGAGVKGCRITPNLYTTTKELDAFIHAVNELSIA